MSKAYWVAVYREVKDPDKLAAYAKLAGPALVSGGDEFWRAEIHRRSMSAA